MLNYLIFPSYNTLSKYRLHSGQGNKTIHLNMISINYMTKFPRSAEKKGVDVDHQSNCKIRIILIFLYTFT